MDTPQLSLPVSTNKFPSSFTSCSTNKVHQQPFGSTSFQSHSPLKLYTPMFGVPLTSLGLAVHAIISHLWINISNIYGFIQCLQNLLFLAFSPNLKCLLKKQFRSTIKTLYLDNGGEFLSLKNYLSNHGISHNTIAPYTPQQNSVSKRRHHHLIEMGFTLLYDVSLPLFYWPHSFQTVSYLINQQPTPLLQNKSPFEVLFHQQPNFLKLKKIRCLCYRITKPYITLKCI